jgi:hypothetical protein
MHCKGKWHYIDTPVTLTAREIKITNHNSQRNINRRKLENYITDIYSLGSHFEFLPLSSLHNGSDDWNRPVRGCMLVAKAGSSTVVTSTTATEMKNIRQRQTDRQTECVRWIE